jgi:hypothetical protein
MNYTAIYLGQTKIDILDEIENPIETITISQEKNIFSFKKPRMKYSLIYKEGIKQQDIRSIQDINELEKDGWGLFQIPIEKKSGWLRRQKFKFALIRLNDPQSAYFKKMSTIYSIISYGLKVLKDDANLLYKLEGRYASPSGSSDWVAI